MKKLMIATAIVCVAVFAQAANYNWGFKSDSISGPTDDYNIDGYLDGGKAMLYIGDVLVATATQDPNDFNFGSFDLSAEDTTGKVQSLADGNIDFTGQAYKLVLRTSDDAYEIVYNGESALKQVIGVPGVPAKNYETFVNITAFGASDWSPVPEPTSGLLLLIGVAGLALRRRRA